MKMPKTGLYAITQTENKAAETVVQAVAAAIRGGADHHGKGDPPQGYEQSAPV